MRICIISDSYPGLPIFAGIAVYTRTAAQGLAARGHEVHVLVGRPKENKDYRDGSVYVHIRPVRWLPILGRWLPGLGESLGLAWALRVLHRQYAFDVVEFPNWEGVGLIGTLWKVAPTVVRLHTSTADAFGLLARRPTRGERFTMWAERISAQMASATITHSKFHRDRMCEQCGLSNVQIVPHGINLATHLSGVQTQRQAVLAVGAFNARKGSETLMEAIPLVLRQVSQVEFWLVGVRADDVNATAFWNEHPEIPREKVRFLGHVSDEKLAELYATCAVYVSAAVYESFGLTFVEAMAYGKPVVGCSGSAVQEIIEDGHTGLLVPPHNSQAFAGAIIRLMQDEPLRTRLGTEGRQNAFRYYSAERMAQDIEEFYTSVSSTVLACASKSSKLQSCRMCVCIVSDSYPGLPIFAGIAVYTRTAAQGLVARGHEVHVLVGRSKERRDYRDGAVYVHLRPVRWLPLLGQWMPGLGESFGVAWALRKLHRQYSFDIVEFPNWEGVGLIGALWKVAPTVVRLYTSTTDAISLLERSPTCGERFTMWAERKSSQWASATVTHSAFHRNNMSRLYRLKNVHTIPLGIDTSKPFPGDLTQKQAVLTVGAFNVRKGAETLLRAIPMVLRQIPQVEFWLVGVREEGPNAIAFWDAHPEIPREKVRFLGHVSDEKLAELYASCAVYVSAAVYESFGLTFVEAMANGKPVVGCSGSAVQEIIEDGRTGLLVPPRNAQAFAGAIIRLMQDEELRTRLGTEGRQNAINCFTAERMAKDIEGLYASVSHRAGHHSHIVHGCY